MSDPKMGHKMQPMTSATAADEISEIMRRLPRKYIAHKTGERLDTVKNWQAGTCVPSATKLIGLARKLPEIKAWLLQKIEAPSEEHLEKGFQEMMRRIEAMEKKLVRTG